jgi:hypothetical protein
VGVINNTQSHNIHKGVKRVRWHFSCRWLFRVGAGRESYTMKRLECRNRRRAQFEYWRETRTAELEPIQRLNNGGGLYASTGTPAFIPE